LVRLLRFAIAEEPLGYEDSPQISEIAINLHYKCQILQFQLQYWHGAPGHFDSSDGIHCCLGRNTIAPAHKKYLDEFRRFPGIDQPSLKQVIS
jgi:hypothetical protein